MDNFTINLFSGGAITVATVAITYFAWLGQRVISHQGQIKHLEDKIDSSTKHLEDKMDLVIASNTALMKSHDDRITRLEKYFDVIMQTQIKRNDQLKMEI